MARGASESSRIAHVSELQDTKVNITSDGHLQIEFRIDDLIKKLVPNINPVANCGGCNGCMGCSM
jgi:hypothetical protein